MSVTETKTWFAVDVVVHAEAAEAIESALNQLGALGTEIDSLKKPKGAPLCVSGYFDALPDGKFVRDEVAEALRIYAHAGDALKSVATRTVEETDWLAEWKKYWKPSEVGRFIITPPWEPVSQTDKIMITIEPNMAFGTGTHETTQLCLSSIGEIYRPAESFLDVGTGTGILAIAAAKLAVAVASEQSLPAILACDTDIDSVKIARENAVANGCGDEIEFFTGSIGEDTPIFDFVCANLTIDVIVPILPLLAAKAGRVLLLSGILQTQREEIEAELRKLGCLDFMIDVAGEWIAVTVRRNSQPGASF